MWSVYKKEFKLILLLNGVIIKKHEGQKNNNVPA